MGSLFSTGDSDPRSMIIGSQTRLLNQAAGTLTSDIANGNKSYDALLKQLFASSSKQGQADAERIFTEGLLRPSLNRFDKEVAPRIGASFGAYGGSLSSRRGDAMAQALSDVYTTAQASLGQNLLAIRSNPLQQTLAQIQGLGALQNIRYQPFGVAGQLATSPVLGGGGSGAGPGWGMLNGALTAAGTIVGGIYGGPGGAALGGTLGSAAGAGISGAAGVKGPGGGVGFSTLNNNPFR